MQGPSWLTIFVDAAPGEWGAAQRFWRGTTGYDVSLPRDGRFVTLLPPHGDDHLRMQRLDDPPSGAHLDLHVADLDAWTGRAAALGATVVARPEQVVLRSPAGVAFCLVRAPGSDPSPPATWPDGHRSRVDQLTLDIPAPAYDDECSFWSELTGWPLQRASRPEMVRLATPAAMPVRVLLQRLDEGPVGAHLDIATDDRPAEVERLRALGAEPIGGGPVWTVMRPPAGPLCCVTDRDPDTGLRPV